MTDPADIHVASLRTALDRADKRFLFSVIILALGLLAGLASSGPNGISLPGGLRVASPEVFFWGILLLHLANGIRYCFYLRRASDIASCLPGEIRKGALSHPSPATSHLGNAAGHMLLLTVLSFPIARDALLAPGLFQFGVALALSSPFLIGPMRMRKDLQFVEPGE